MSKTTPCNLDTPIADKKQFDENWDAIDWTDGKFREAFYKQYNEGWDAFYKNERKRIEAIIAENGD